MSGKRKSQRIEESAKKPMLDVEISDKLTDTKKIPDVVWQKIFGFFSLEEIKLNVAKVCRHFYEISNNCVQEIRINEYELNMFYSDKKYEMFDAIPTFKYLNTIKITGYGEDTETPAQGIEYFVMHALKNCPRLKQLDITSHNLSIDFIKYIIKYGQNLNTLELCFEHTDESGILSLISELKNLKKLSLIDLKQSDNYETEELITLVENLKLLNKLKLHNCDVADDTIVKLINLKKNELKEFCVLKGCIGDDWLKELLNCPKLEKFYVSGVHITKCGFETISKLKNLTCLQLGHRVLHSEKAYKSNDVMKMLSNGKYKNLKELYVYGIIDSIDPIIMCVTLACPNLQLFYCKCLADKRKDFPKNSLKFIIDNLIELKIMQFEWEIVQRDNPIFLKSELEEIVRNDKNKFKVKVGVNWVYMSQGVYYEWFRITRKM